MILQLDPPIEVETPHGRGMAVLVIDYGLGWNTIWVVALKETQAIKHYESSQLLACKNFTLGYVAK